MDMDRKQAIIENLEDAGYPSDLTGAFMVSLYEGRKKEGMRLLEAHRRTLLAELHRNQKKIDCLDYLVYQLQKYEKEL